MTDDLATRLGELDTCAVSDALDRCGFTGVARGLRPLSVNRRIAGRVVTVRLKPHEAGNLSRRHLGTAAVDAAARGAVIVVDHQGREDAAGWGGILSRAAQHKGVAGVIVDGACRDIDECREIGLPVFGTAATPLTARGRAVEDSFNEPISIRNIRVSPGDLVIADGSGVVFIQAAQAEQVVATAEAIAAREREMTEAVLTGRSVTEVMDETYETMLRSAET